MVGIVSFGAYIPRLRLNRGTVINSMAWLTPQLMAYGNGERAICNWDEDPMTMGVSASQDCLKGLEKQKIDAVYMASTTFPFSDRQNSGILKGALNLDDGISTADFAASLRCSTTATLAAIDAVQGGEKENVLVTAADQRRTKAASVQEMYFGDGSGSVVIGKENVIAEFLGSYSLSVDFVSHYRGNNMAFDYNWEERWIREEGYMKLYPQAIQAALDKQGISMKDITKVIFPCLLPRAHGKIASKIGAIPEQISPILFECCGECGTAHPFIMLINELENASPGDILLMAGYGQGVDVLMFKVTKEIKNLTPREGVSVCLNRKKIEDSYTKTLQYRYLIDTDLGARAEADERTILSVMWRNRKLVLGFVGGKCTACGTPQIPAERICVNPACGAVDKMEDYEFADLQAKVLTFTADHLAPSFDPPSFFGMIQFDAGGRIIVDFADCELDDIEVGIPMKLAYRKSYQDERRGFTGYFWKAVPIRATT